MRLGVFLRGAERSIWMGSSRAVVVVEDMVGVGVVGVSLEWVRYVVWCQDALS